MFLSQEALLHWRIADTELLLLKAPSNITSTFSNKPFHKIAINKDELCFLLGMTWYPDLTYPTPCDCAS